MFRRVSMFLLCSFLSVSAFAQYWGPNKALNSQTQNTLRQTTHDAAQEAAAQHTQQAALKAEFYMSHQYESEYQSEEDVFEGEWEDFTVYQYQTSASDPDAFQEGDIYYIESETPLPGRQLVGTIQRRVPRPYSNTYQYRIECKAYALTDNWAVMAGTCLNPKMYNHSDMIIIGGLRYNPEPVNVALEGKILVQGKPVSKYYHSAAMTLLYAAPNTPLARTLADAPKVNLRIFNKVEDMSSLSLYRMLINGKKRTLKGRPKNNKIELNENVFGFFAGQASDALFYQKSDKVFLIGFNNARFSPIPNIDNDLRHRWGECTRKKSAVYYTFSQEQLDFIKNTTGKDWNDSVRHHIYVSK